ncbi:unnamed protein product [Penicillium olsonii]|nr:unnamed protein product [Penicillium olsonii]
MSSLTFNSPRNEIAITKGMNVKLMKYLSSIIPWNNLQYSPNVRSASRTSAALSTLLPEDEPGQYEKFSTDLSSSSAGIRDIMGLAFYLISNNLSSEDDGASQEAIHRDDELALQTLKDIGWDDLSHLKILLSSRESTVESITERLFAAALRSRTFDIVEKMLRAGGNPNILFRRRSMKDGESLLTPLQIFSEHAGDAHSIDLLISHGADVNFINEDGYTALSYAIAGRNWSAIRLLLDNGATVTSQCARSAIIPYFPPSLMTPDPGSDHNGLLGEIIDIYLAQDEAIHRDDTEILRWAVEYSNVNMIQRFVAKGARVNGFVTPPFKQGSFRTTLLGLAVLKGRMKIVRMLLHISPLKDLLHIDPPYISPLALAAEHGHLGICKVLLSSGADLRAADEGEKTLLERAVRKRDLSLCQMLINHGAKVDREPQEAQWFPSALMIAVQQSSMDIVDLLIASNARLNDTFNEFPSTILAAAVEAGNVAMIEKLENAGATNLGFKIKEIANLQTALYLENTEFFQTILDHSGPNLLAAAISKMDDPLTWFLLHKIPRLDQHTTVSVGKTPLLAAIQTDNFIVVVALLERGVQVTDHELQHVILHDRSYLLSILLLGFTGHAPLAVSAAVLKSSMACLKSLREANVGFTGAPQMSHHGSFLRSSIPGYCCPHISLEAAISVADESMFKFLLEWVTSAQTNWSRDYIACALTLAIFERNDGYIFDLMQFDSNINCSVTKGPSSLVNARWLSGHDAYTPLQAAVRNQLVPVVRDLLVLKRADVNYLGDGKLRRTPLQHAVEVGNMEISDLLLEHGADVNAPAADDGGATALQIAAIKGFIGIARRLLDLGADVNQAPAIENGRTALGGAAEYGRIDMLQMLVNEGALVVGEYEDQYLTAVKLAEGRGHYAAAKLLRSFKESVELAA